MSEQRPAAPADLGDHGRALWADVVEHYDLRPDELRILAHACREEDLIARMSAEVAASDLLAEGYMGQPVSAPLVSELRQHRGTFASLMKQLKIPDDAERAGESASEKARRAALARWRTTAPAPRSS